MNHPEEITKITPNHIIKWVLKERQQWSGSCLPSHLGAEQLEEEGQLLELRLVSELGSGGVVQLAERRGSVCLASDGAHHGLAPFIGEESNNGVA